jgi:hypothetical protein
VVSLILDHNLRKTRQIANAFQPLVDHRMRFLRGEGPTVRFVAFRPDDAMSIGDDQIELLLDEGWRPEDLTLHTTGGRHPEQVSRHESGNASYWDSSGTSSMSSTVTGSSSRDWSAERSFSSSSMSPPPVAMGRGDGGPAVQTLGSTPSINCQPLSISVSTNPVASQSVASKAIAAQQLWTSRIHATNKFAARNNYTAHLHRGASVRAGAELELEAVGLELSW